MIEISKIGNSLGVKIELNNSNLLIIKADKGFIMCGYLDIKTAEKLGDAACVVRGVKNFEDMMNAKIVLATESAKNLGVIEGMEGREALKLLE